MAEKVDVIIEKLKAAADSALLPNVGPHPILEERCQPF